VGGGKERLLEYDIDLSFYEFLLIRAVITWTRRRHRRRRRHHDTHLKCYTQSRRALDG